MAIHSVKIARSAVSFLVPVNKTGTKGRNR